MEGMEAAAGADAVLDLFQVGIEELHHLPALQADQVIVMLVLPGRLIVGVGIAQARLVGEAALDQQIQGPVHSGAAHGLASGVESRVELFGIEMRAAGKDGLHDFKPLPGELQLPAAQEGFEPGLGFQGAGSGGSSAGAQGGAVPGSFVVESSFEWENGSFRTEKEFHMPLVIIQAPPLSRDQKNRVGSRIVDALHAEGIAPGSILVLFRPEEADIYVDGGLVHECPPRDSGVADSACFEEAERPRNRRNRADLEALRTQLIQALQLKGQMSSFEAQTELGLKDDENGAAILRRLFSELDAEGLIVKHGQKRGTRYGWKGFSNIPSQGVPGAILMKKDEELG